MGRPLRSGDDKTKWELVWSRTIMRCPGKDREAYMRLKPKGDRTKKTDKDAESGNEDAPVAAAKPKQRGRRGNAKAAPNAAAGATHSTTEEVPLVMARGGDLAYLNSIFCRQSPSADITQSMMESLLRWLDCLANGTAAEHAKDRSLKRDALITKNQNYLDVKFRAGDYRPFFWLNSAEWNEMFNRMCPIEGWAPLDPKSPQLTLEEAIQVCRFMNN
jgi:hypothetical protein